MASSLIRGKYVIGKAENRTDVTVIEDGAVFQRDGTVVEIGRHQDLAAKYQPDAILGSTGHVVMPGFVDTHTHDDTALPRWPGLEFKLAQGVTSVVVGNCGFSAAPGVGGECGQWFGSLRAGCRAS